MRTFESVPGAPLEWVRFAQVKHVSRFRVQTCEFENDDSPAVGGEGQVLPGLMAENDLATLVHPAELIPW